MHSSHIYLLSPDLTHQKHRHTHAHANMIWCIWGTHIWWGRQREKFTHRTHPRRSAILAPPNHSPDVARSFDLSRQAEVWWENFLCLNVGHWLKCVGQSKHFCWLDLICSQPYCSLIREEIPLTPSSLNCTVSGEEAFSHLRIRLNNLLERDILGWAFYNER